MRFKHKLIFLYTILALSFSAVMTITCHFFLTRNTTQEIKNQLSYTASQISSQFENMYNSMSGVGENILFSPEICTAIRFLSIPENSGDIRFSDNLSLVQKQVNANNYISHYYRILFYNQAGVLVYSAADLFEGIVNTASLPEENLLSAAEQMKGAPLIIPSHKDNWNSNARQPVFSVLRAIQGNSLGYIEVQQKEDYLTELFTLPNEQMRLAILLPGREVFYSSAEPSASLLQKYAENVKPGIYRDNEYETFMGVFPCAGGCRILLSLDNRHIHSSATKTLCIVLLAGFGTFALSLGFIIFSSGLITRPISQIGARLENMDLPTLGEELRVNTPYDELQTLQDIYNRLFHRLSLSIEKEKKLSLLQLQTQFDLLQAQVDPHFLYNILNVINNRGLENDDMAICEICGHLASMLRYSTGTVNRYSSVREELDYVTHYAYLMKARYEDRLAITENVDPDIYREILPKITIQQLVENSIRHGYQNTGRPMQIRLTGGRDSRGWYITVEDNGEGISEDTQKQLREKIRELKAALLERGKLAEMEIGHMGIPNLFARLYLTYQDKVILSIGNTPQGAKVSIRIQKEAKNVPDNDRG